MAKSTSKEIQDQRHLTKVLEARQQLQILRAHQAELSDMGPRSLYSDLLKSYHEHMDWIIKENPAYLQAAAELYLENSSPDSIARRVVDDE